MSITLKSNVDGSSTLQNNGVDIINVSNTNTVSIPQNITLNNATLNGTVNAPLAAQFSSNANVATTEFVQRALGNVRGFQDITANTTLTAADAGKTTSIGGSTASTTVTLPLLSTCPAGTRFHFICLNNNILTIQRQGSELIYGNGTGQASFALLNGDSLTIESFGSLWVASGGSAQLAKAGVFGASLAANGYQKLPSGLIIQWGTVTVATGVNVVTATTSFPIAFPNACVSLQATCLDTKNGAAYNVAEVPCVVNALFSAANFTWKLSAADAGTMSNNHTFRWEAIGY